MLRLVFSLLCLFIMPIAHAASAASPVILVFGDSLSAGYGMAVEQSWPALLVKRLEDNHLRYRVSNASISGETSAGGRSRLPDTLANVHPSVVVIALGANDGLRGLPVAQLRENLTAMIRSAKSLRARVLLVGMRLPPNYGADYAREFENSFGLVAKQEDVALLPFLLAPIAADASAFQADGIHPAATAQAKILDHVWPALKPLLR